MVLAEDDPGPKLLRAKLGAMGLGISLGSLWWIPVSLQPPKSQKSGMHEFPTSHPQAKGRAGDSRIHSSGRPEETKQQ